MFIVKYFVFQGSGRVREKALVVTAAADIAAHNQTVAAYNAYKLRLYTVRCYVTKSKCLYQQCDYPCVF